MNKKQKEKKLCDLIGYSCSVLAREGLSWTYSCFKDSDGVDGEVGGLYGEGELLIYYMGYDYKQDEHGRLMFVAGDEKGGDDGEIHMIVSWGVQGPGEHVHNPILPATKKEIKPKIKEMAEWLKTKRISIEN